jgi:hypothetical protein
MCIFQGNQEFFENFDFFLSRQLYRAVHEIIQNIYQKSELFLPHIAKLRHFFHPKQFFKKEFTFQASGIIHGRSEGNNL